MTLHPQEHSRQFFSGNDGSSAPTFTPCQGLPGVKQSGICYVLFVDSWLSHLSCQCALHRSMKCEFMLTDPISCVFFISFSFIFLIVLLCFACACLFECGCRYFGDQIGDVFTEEDFQLYRFVHCLIHSFLMPVTYNFVHVLFMFMS